ncbi:LCR [Medicago truncatula]|uniref:LCR n=1 Tax=Medicago truncatula TaxID=3880 RepID=G7L3F7_MEDTR|nr:LCR [Medicago truncatula]
MASHINQSRLCWILCFAFVLLSGLSIATIFHVDYLGQSCLYKKCMDFTQCAQECLKRGYKNGGECVGSDHQNMRCCCYGS